MAKLIITPIDPEAQGSHAKRMAIYRVVGELDTAQKAKDMGAVVAGYVRLNDVLRPYLRTDNGVTVDEVLAEISASEFDRLVAGVTEEVGDQATVPPVNDAPSPTPPKASGRRLPGRSN